MKKTLNKLLLLTLISVFYNFGCDVTPQEKVAVLAVNLSKLNEIKINLGFGRSLNLNEEESRILTSKNFYKNGDIFYTTNENGIEALISEDLYIQVFYRLQTVIITKEYDALNAYNLNQNPVQMLQYLSEVGTDWREFDNIISFRMDSINVDSVQIHLTETPIGVGRMRFYQKNQLGIAQVSDVVISNDIDPNLDPYFELPLVRNSLLEDDTLMIDEFFEGYQINYFDDINPFKK